MPVQSDNPPQLFTLQEWQGLNQQARRGSIGDQEEWWNENLFSMGPGNLRSCWGPGAAIYTAPAGTTILRMFFGYYGDTTPQFTAPPPGRFGWMFLSNGHIDEVDLDTQAVNHVGPILSRATGTGTSTGDTNLDVTGSSGTIVIGATVTGDSVPANTTVVSQQSGTTGGDGTYTLNNATTLAAVALSFSGPITSADPYAVWEPIAPQYWASAKVWRPQYFGNVAGQQGGVLFGSPQGLYAWDGTLYSPGDVAPDWLTDQQETDPGPPIYVMPDGLPGIYCMEVYQSRLWVAGKDVISFTAPSNGADFSTTDGGGSFGYFGDRLTYNYVDMAQGMGYLYVFGDSSIDMISNVQMSGLGTPEQPFTTNFNYENIDPQTGHRFPRPVGRVGRFFQMFNGAGIFECRGAEARVIGNKVTTILNTLDASQYYPTMCPATMFGFRVLLCNGMFTDPWGVKRNLLLMWHPSGRGGQNDFWSVTSQGLNLTHIGSYEQDSVITPYGTDGTSLYQLFARPDTNLIKKLSTKFYRGENMDALTVKNIKRLFLEFDDLAGLGVAFTGQLISGGGGVPGGVRDIGFQMAPGAGGAFEPQPTEGAGIYGGVDLISTSPDFTIERLHVLSESRTLWGA
jgi:hypothetical protein